MEERGVECQTLRTGQVRWMSKTHRTDLDGTVCYNNAENWSAKSLQCGKMSVSQQKDVQSMPSSFQMASGHPWSGVLYSTWDPLRSAHPEGSAGRWDSWWRFPAGAGRAWRAALTPQLWEAGTNWNHVSDEHLGKESRKEPRKRAWGWPLIHAGDQKAGEIVDGREGDESRLQSEKKQHPVREAISSGESQGLRRREKSLF